MSTAQVDLVYPRGIPDLFRGSQVTLIGRYRNQADLNSVRLTLSGESGGSTRTYHYDELSFPVRNENNDYLPRLWATRRVGWLMEQVRSNGEQKELRDEIVDLGTRYGIVTPYTSYLALEPENQRQLSLVPGASPQPSPQGRGFSGGAFRRAAKSAPSAGNAQAANAPPAVTVTADTGYVAVQESKRMRQQQESDKLKDDTRTDAVQRIGGKTFYLIDEVWTDSEFKAESNLPETATTFGSEEYFALLKKYPKLANYLSLGERVVVVFEGRVYRINAAATP
jgi:Ca-activated chloride channel family protein